MRTAFAGTDKIASLTPLALARIALQIETSRKRGLSVAAFESTKQM
jgi:hypothetical protein